MIPKDEGVAFGGRDGGAPANEVDHGVRVTGVDVGLEWLALASHPEAPRARRLLDEHDDLDVAAGMTVGDLRDVCVGFGREVVHASHVDQECPACPACVGLGRNGLGRDQRGV